MTDKIFLHPITQKESFDETIHLMKIVDNALHRDPANRQQAAARTLDIQKIQSEMGPMSPVERARITRNINWLSKTTLGCGEQKIEGQRSEFRIFEGCESAPVAKLAYEGNELKSITFRSMDGDDSYGREITVDLPHAPPMANAKEFMLANGAMRTVEYDSDLKTPISIYDSSGLAFYRSTNTNQWIRDTGDGEIEILEGADLSVANDGSINYTMSERHKPDLNVHEHVAENGDLVTTYRMLGQEHQTHEATSVHHEEFPKDGETHFILRDTLSSVPDAIIIDSSTRKQMLNGDYIVDTPGHTVTSSPRADKVIIEYKDGQGKPNGKATYMVERDGNFRITSGRIAIDYPDGSHATYNDPTDREFEDLRYHTGSDVPPTIYDVRRSPIKRIENVVKKGLSHLLGATER